MPTPDLPAIGDNPSNKEVVDYLIKLQRDYTWLLQNLDDLNVKRIRADSIYAGTIDANVVTIRSDLTAGAYIQIDGNGMVVNNGSYDTFEVDIDGNVTATSMTLKSANGYPLVEINKDDNLFAAYTDPDTYIQIIPEFTNDKPAILFVDGSTAIGYISAPGAMEFYAEDELHIKSGTGAISFETMSLFGIEFPSWDDMHNVATNRTLQQDLDAKATAGASTSSASGGSHNHGIPNGAQIALSSDGSTVTGTVTWSAYAGFTHSHVQQL